MQRREQPPALVISAIVFGTFVHIEFVELIFWQQLSRVYFVNR
jgi:hypothetical protein